jgi:hypothetical protein
MELWFTNHVTDADVGRPIAEYVLQWEMDGLFTDLPGRMGVRESYQIAVERHWIPAELVPVFERLRSEIETDECAVAGSDAELVTYLTEVLRPVRFGRFAQ